MLWESGRVGKGRCVRRSSTFTSTFSFSFLFTSSSWVSGWFLVFVSGFWYRNTYTARAFYVRTWAMCCTYRSGQNLTKDKICGRTIGCVRTGGTAAVKRRRVRSNTTNPLHQFFSLLTAAKRLDVLYLYFILSYIYYIYIIFIS